MSKRIKPSAMLPVIKSIDDADATLAKIAALRRNVSLVETGLNEDIDRLKLVAADQAEPYRQEIASLEQALMRYAEYHKGELFLKKKSIELSFGSFGYRASSKIKLLSKTTWERVLQCLRDDGRKDCIRIKEEPDKEILKAQSPEYLKDIGCKVVQADTFFYELAETDISPVSGEAA